ncbi:GGDEF domain-containing protein [Granulicella tundricola]|uniref:diguanylate cyclase n=1 Tax=Granulicella tundricola (strain ATCC BAA-1859 / DSM 23138 / MP5ACTX9) TaxID=1198114 RepID=E8X5X9_GRATM|nr:sensor domain-containing diguanylate cyclase [Granulicella tundricola]ADW70863.1 diguanylate cyclase with PAS/PAC sensor [Granulicella tundricola MP5ACTX9]
MSPSEHVESRIFRLMAEYSIDVLCRISMDLHCTYCSPSATKTLGWSTEEMLALFPLRLIHEEDKGRIRMAHQRLMDDPDCENSPATARVRAKDGSYLWFEFNARLLRDLGENAPWQVLLNMRDISERKLLEQRLEALALTDGLTGIGNRRSFDQEMQRVAAQNGYEGRRISLILLDVDHFKAFNDAYGHLVGDDCLRTLADALASSLISVGGFVARYGGEELVAIVTSADPGGDVQLAECLRHHVEQLRIPHQGNAAHGSVVTVSVGVATAVEQSGGSITDLRSGLLQAADAALYKSKGSGRNKVSSSLIILSPQGV